VIGFPLLLIPFAIYNMIAFLTPGVSWTAPVYAGQIPLQSGVPWMANIGEAFLVFTLLMLMFEFIKSARTGKSFVEHFLSLCLAGGAAAEFWMVREAGNSTFLLFVVICFVDLFAGFAQSLRRARKAVVVAEPAVQPPVMAPVARPAPVPVERAAPVAAEPVRSEPRVEPAPARVEPTPARDPFTKAEPIAPRAEPEIIPPVQKAAP
jgi:hypothetical protein